MTFRSSRYLRKKLPDNADNPPTIAPTMPDIRINRADEPPSGNKVAIRVDKMLLFCASIHQASNAQNNKMLIKPDK